MSHHVPMGGLSSVLCILLIPCVLRVSIVTAQPPIKTWKTLDELSEEHLVKATIALAIARTIRGRLEARATRSSITYLVHQNLLAQHAAPSCDQLRLTCM
jgi:hypothetical protein